MPSGDTKHQAALRKKTNESWDVVHNGPDTQKKIFQWIKEVSVHNGVMIDIGCGTGHLLASLRAESWICHYTMIGLDASMDMIQYAQELTTDIAWIVADHAALPFENKSVDVILSRLADFTPTELSRVLKRKGFFFEFGLGPLDSREIAEVFRGRFLEAYDPVLDSTYLSDRTELLQHSGLATKRLEVIHYIEYLTHEQLEDVIEMVPLVKDFSRDKDANLINDLARYRHKQRKSEYPVTRQVTLRLAQKIE